MRPDMGPILGLMWVSYGPHLGLMPPGYPARALVLTVSPCPGEAQNATYIVKSGILEAQQSPKWYVYSEIGDSEVRKSLKCYVYSEIGDSGGTQITQMLRIE